MKTMAAYRLHTWGQDPDLTTMAAPAAVPRDVLLGARGRGGVPGLRGVPYEVPVQTTYWGNRGELGEVVDLTARGLLRSPVTTYRVAQAAAACGDLAEGRAMIAP